jgi:hypothetical protein
MKEHIRAIHNDEVVNFFRSIGLLSDLEDGKLSCEICSDPLTVASFQAAAKLNGKLIFCCNRPSCYLIFLFKTQGKA